MPNRFALTLAIVLTTLSLSVQASAQSVAIAFEGDVDPGGSGGVFNVLGRPVVNDAGIVAFRSTISSGSASEGMYRAAGSGVAAVALSGEPAPDTGGGTFSTFGDPAINASGDVAFVATVSGGSANAGIWQSTPAGLITIVTTEVVAPGTAGAFYIAFGSPIALNDDGEIAFFANVGSSATPSGIFVEGSVAGRPVFLTNDATPADVINGTYFNFGRPAINADGSVAVPASIFSGISTFTESIVVRDAAGPRVAVFAGEVAPDTTGGTFANFNFTGPPALDDTGAVSFTANVTGGTAQRGLFREDAGLLSSIELQGEEAFGTGGGDFFFFQQDRLPGNANGGVGFASNLLGGSANAGAFFTLLGGSSYPIAVVGDPVPNTASNTYLAFPSAPDISDAGDAVFLARQGPAFDDVIVRAVPEPGFALAFALSCLVSAAGPFRGARDRPSLFEKRSGDCDG